MLTQEKIYLLDEIGIVGTQNKRTKRETRLEDLKTAKVIQQHRNQLANCRRPKSNKKDY